MVKLGPKLSFCHFLKVASLVFVYIAQDYSLRQCLHLVELKPPKEVLWPKLGPNKPRSVPK